jgi:hypothetical protein
MTAYEYIIAKQTQWALNRGIELIGSKVSKGFPAYTPELNQNLFQPLDLDVRKSFEQGDGNEISGNPAKMQASLNDLITNSSSILDGFDD